MDDPIYAETYRNFVAQSAAEEYDGIWATARFQAAHDLIKPFVIGESGENPNYGFVTSEATFDASLSALVAQVQQRQSDVARFLSEWASCAMRKQSTRSRSDCRQGAQCSWGFTGNSGRKAGDLSEPHLSCLTKSSQEGKNYAEP